MKKNDALTQSSLSALRHVLFFLCALCGLCVQPDVAMFAQPSPTAAELKAKAERKVQDIAGRVDGVVGYAILDLTSGDRIGHLDRETFPRMKRKGSARSKRSRAPSTSISAGSAPEARSAARLDASA